MTLRSLIFRSTPPFEERKFIQHRAPIRGRSCLYGKEFNERITARHAYIERGRGPVIIFCPGLYGSLYNISEIGMALSENYRFIVPYLPLYDLPLVDCTVPRLAEYLHSFMNDLAITEALFIGSSMGGGTLLHYALQDSTGIKGLVLCGSSGLSTIPMQKGFFRRKDYSFVQQTVRDVFCNPNIPCPEMINEVFDAIQDYEIVLRSIRLTKSTAVDQVHDRLGRIGCPCLLIWGKQDQITPPGVAASFQRLLPNSELFYLDQCGHVPTQERPKETLRLIQTFLTRIDYC